MNASFKPTILTKAVDEKSFPFVVPLHLTEANLKLLEPLWAIGFKKDVNSPTLGQLNFQLTRKVAEPKGILYLSIQLGSHKFNVFFSSSEWLDNLLGCFEDGFRLEGHEDIAGLALEALFLDQIISVEKSTGKDLTFHKISASAPKMDHSNSPGACFEMRSDVWTTSEVSIFPTTIEAQKALVDLLTQHRVKEPPKSKDYKSTTLDGSLIADAAEITRKQLHNLKQGDGFLLNENWLEVTSYNLVVADKILATVSKKETTFEVDEVFITTEAKKPVEEPAQVLRRPRRNNRENNK